MQRDILVDILVQYPAWNNPIIAAQGLGKAVSMTEMERMSKQLVLSGRLKPHMRLGVAISEVAQALDGDSKNEFRRMQTTSNYLGSTF